ncbi:Gfo/Idh/MocA family oxidoreductase [bacterium]|nr:MAG: Gfo/Idh/MocA family oxidoreductase [bacterium]
MQSNKKIGVGIIGLSANGGWAARAHVPALQSLPEYEIRALTASTPQSAKAAAEKFGVPHYFTDPVELAALPEVDLVVVSVKVPEHKYLVEAAINAGKMVYCEWPLGNGLAEAQGLEALAREKEVPAFVGLQSHGVPVVRWVKDLVASRYVGEVLSTTVVGSGIIAGATVDNRGLYLLDPANGATMLSIPFGHSIDAMCWALGEFRELSAITANQRPQVTNTDTGAQVAKLADDNISISGILESGAVATIHYRGGASKATNFRWEINGTEGDLVVLGDSGHLQFGQVTLYGAKGDDKALAELTLPAEYVAAPGSPTDISYPITQMYQGVLSDLRDGTQLVPTFADAVKRHQMLEAIEQSAKSGTRQSY